MEVATQPRRPLISLIIPVLNEEDSIARLETEVNDVFRSIECDGEFLVIDNGSTDKTPQFVRDLCSRDKRWKYIRFSRNFSVEMSITAGYTHATGDAMIVLYSDLQDPPDVIPRFVAKWKEGFDVVYGVRTVRPGDPQWRNFLVKIAYRVISWFSDVAIPTDTGDFRLINRPVRDALLQCTEYNRYTRGLIAWLGFRQVGIEYERRARTEGKSKGPFWLLFLIVFNAITSFSLKPLRLFTLMGFVILTIAFLASLGYVYTFFMAQTVPGLTTVNVLILASIGLNSLGIGILGEYVGRTYSEVKGRPLYIIQEAVNITPEPWQRR